ncbi:MAG: GyrI-like domain-containing protein [Verrucomicrobiae bacterium]|nr:GyrI-like domain-containing protein [Verrucomicrobiae bacterium]
MEKIDLYKIHKLEYITPKKPRLLQIKPAHYLAISGQGKPGGEKFTTKIGALYSVAFTLKMTRKFKGHQDYTIGKLECQWFVDSKKVADQTSQDQWRWKLLIRTPDFVTQSELDHTIAALLKKGKEPIIREVNLELLDENQCVQMLHIGPYDQESKTVAIMKSFVEANGLTLKGPHHEIYLSDPRRVPSERLKTILREPVAIQ